MAKRRTAGIALSADQNWRVESDLRTLMDAEEIENDPKRYAAACALAKKKMLDMATIASESEGDK